jgi:hypothetical protein
MMKRLIPILSAGALVLPTLALAQDDKEQSCAYQAQVVTAIQEARKDRVRERDLAQAIADSEPDWPDNYNNAIPLIAPWVYEQPMKVIRNEDLGAAWLELCLQQG